MHRGPDPTRRAYRERHVAGPGDRLTLAALTDAIGAVDDLLPAPDPTPAK